VRCYPLQEAEDVGDLIFGRASSGEADEGLDLQLLHASAGISA
jgi:hypothetical protein